jgi:hypothetical protein
MCDSSKAREEQLRVLNSKEQVQVWSEADPGLPQPLEGKEQGGTRKMASTFFGSMNWYH